LADKSQSLVLDALARAAAEPRGLPLLGTKAAAGLFAKNAAGKKAAQHTKNEGLVRVLREETKGKSTQEICILTEKGLGLLLAQANPGPALDAFVCALEAVLVRYLARRQESGALDDCSLPELYRHLRAHASGLTMGQFHDLLVRLLESGTIYLHPWTGPLYELPEPACALLVGHEVAYYASLRKTLSPDP
jgi:hypothetical protein